MKKLFFFTMFLFIISSSIFSENKKIKIGISIPSVENDWSSGIVYWANKSVNDWKKKTKDYDYYITKADNSQHQILQIEEFIKKGVSAMVVLPTDTVAIAPVCEKAKKLGIFLIVVDRELYNSTHDIFVSGDNKELGKIAGETIAKKIGGKGKIIVIEATPGVNNTERVESFKEVLKSYPNIEILDSQFSFSSMQRGTELMETFLKKYDHIDAVWTLEDDVLKGALKAYKESKRKDIKTFLGGGGNKDIVKMIIDKNQLISADISYHPSMISTAISCVVMALRGEKINNFYQKQMPSRIILKSELITRDNAKYFYFPDSAY